MARDFSETTSTFVELHNQQGKLATIDYDMEDENLIPTKDALATSISELVDYGQSVPSEAEFIEIQKKLGIKEMGRVATTSTVVENDPEEMTSLDISRPDIVTKDNKEKEFIEDDFLKRAGYTRTSGYGKDSAIVEYLRYFNKDFIIIFHKKYSPLGDLGVSCFKAMSRYLESFPLPTNYDKVILVERRFATFVFGYSPTLSSRNSYINTYAAYANANKIEDFRVLDPHGKKKFLRNQRALPCMEEVKVEEIVEEEPASKVQKL